jgi:Tol biopolymer transport system component/DNA-binding winged helix-turn-helix (wHTH) protein
MPAVDQKSSHVVRFGLYEADLTARELRRDGSVVKLQDRPFEVLAILLERPSEVITREEFRQRLWSADTFVDFDASLNTSVNKLRQALSDNAENPRFIATAGRRGYRFIAPTSVVKAGAPAPAARESPLPVPEPGVPDKTAGHGSSKYMVKYAALGFAAILLIAIIVFAALRPEPQPKVSNLVQISRDGLLDPWGKLSTDGARLFYLDRVGGHWTLMQAPASGGDAQPFPEPSQNIRVVDISPDRAQLLTFAFHGRSRDLPLSLTPVVGGPPRRVGDILADDAVFSPDGRRIFFSRPDGIYSCALDGSQLQKLVALPDRSEDPQWSKDGKRLRFTLQDRSANGTSIWEVAADGSNLHAVNLNLPAPGKTCCGRWSADGRYFFFTAYQDELQSIWAIREGGHAWLPRVAKPVQLTFGPNNYGGLVTDANPNRVFVWSGIEQLETALYYPDSGRVQPLLPGIHSQGASLSQDGAWLAYAAGGELWRSKADGSQRQPLVSGFPPINYAQWSPDQKHILFHTLGGGSGKYFLVSADGGPATELSLGSGHNEPTWSPDGATIVFAKWAMEEGVSNSQSGIFLLDLKTSQIAKVPGSEGLIHPNFSPDRRFLAAITNFDQNPNQPTRVKLFDTLRQTWTEITHGTLVNPVQWSSDSKYFFYQDILGEGQPSFRYSLAANKSELHLDFESLLHAGYVRCLFLRFAPDGSLVMSLRRNEVNIYRLDLDFP